MQQLTWLVGGRIIKAVLWRFAFAAASSGVGLGAMRAEPTEAALPGIGLREELAEQRSKHPSESVAKAVKKQTEGSCRDALSQRH